MLRSCSLPANATATCYRQYVLSNKYVTAHFRLSHIGHIPQTSRVKQMSAHLSCGIVFCIFDKEADKCRRIRRSEFGLV